MVLVPSGREERGNRPISVSARSIRQGRVEAAVSVKMNIRLARVRGRVNGRVIAPAYSRIAW